MRSGLLDAVSSSWVWQKYITNDQIFLSHFNIVQKNVVPSESAKINILYPLGYIIPIIPIHTRNNGLELGNIATAHFIDAQPCDPSDAIQFGTVCSSSHSCFMSLVLRSEPFVIDILLWELSYVIGPN